MSLTNKERGRLDRLKDRCHVLQARLDANTAGKQDWEQELSALSWAVAKIEAFPPEALCIPDGWKLVPINPTEEMRVAGNDTGEFENDYPRDSRRAADHVWRVMLESAPSIPSPQLRLCGCPGACQGYATLSKGVVCSMHVPESIARPKMEKS